MQLPTPDDVAAAAQRIAGHVVRTPMLRNPHLDRLTGGTILLKPECLQQTGSFKLRGAVNAALQLTPGQRRAGVVTHSSGNHGQALACAAASIGASATIYMPADAPRVKVDATSRWGAAIVPFDRMTADRAGLAATHAERTGTALIPPFDHPHVMAGQGTLAFELAEDAGRAGLRMDAMLVCTGGGGLIAVCALALAQVSQAETMQGQLDQMTASQRPWLSLADLSITGVEIYPVGAGVVVDAKYRLTDLGQSPAVAVSISTQGHSVLP